ncbi:roadblock/LC7 domain-containing protein [Micromonospora sp. NPDC049799]|uniref:roadblock/LC7 domain-containing protein n=1 Tax=unclassified Micromonospora TaxID=2617518 RepID=UPI0033D87720
MTNSAHSNLTWILDDLVRVPDVVCALVLSADGLVVQKSSSLQQDPADSLAAGASSLHSVAAGIGRFFDSGSVQQVIIEYRKRTLFVAEAGKNARLAVLCEQSVDMGTVAYEMGRMVTRIGEYLGSEARTPVPSNGQPGTGHA